MGTLVKSGILSIALAIVLLPALAALINPLKLRADHVTARVFDIDRAAAWYQHMLGFEIRRRGKHGDVLFVELTIPGFGIALIKEPLATQLSAQENAGTPRWVHIVFSVPDPDVAYRSLRSKGATVSTSDDASRGAVNRFLVKDTEGNEIEILADSASLN